MAKFKLLFFVRLATALSAVFFIGNAQSSVLVHVVQNDPTSTDASTVPSSTLPSANFISPDINFNIGNSGATSLATFLNNPTFMNQQNGFDATQPADNTFLEISAQTFLNAGVNSFVVGHDDGVLLTFADPALGVVVSATGPTSFTNSPFNVTVATAGYYAFDLKYTECCGGPADLVFQVNGAPVSNPTIPEPANVALTGIGFAAMAFGARAYRRKRTA